MLPLIKLAYTSGKITALEKLGRTHLPTLDEGTEHTLGLTDISPKTRAGLLKEHYQDVAPIEIPDLPQYQQESASTGRWTGGILGAVVGSLLGQSMSSAAVGGIGGASLGHFIGKGVGESDYYSDTDTQSRAQRSLKDPKVLALETARMAGTRRHQDIQEQQAHERRLRRIPENRYNINYNV